MGVCGPVALAQDTSREANLIESKAQQVSSVLADNLLGETKQIEDAEAVFVGIGGECHVDSRVNAYIKVYINGRYRGTIPPWGDIFPFGTSANN